MKRSAKLDKKTSPDEQANEAETAVPKGQMGKVYKITKSLCKNNNTTISYVKDKQESILTSKTR